MRLLRLLAFSTLLLFFASQAHAQISSLMEELENGYASLVEINEANAQLTVELNQERKAYWEENDLLASGEIKAGRYRDLLIAKDYNFLVTELLNRLKGNAGAGLGDVITMLGGGKVDGGVQPYAKKEFNKWTNKVVGQMLEKANPRDPFTFGITMGTEFAAANEAALDVYKSYRSARNVAEYLFSHSNSPLMSSNPETYLTGWLLATKISAALPEAQQRVKEFKSQAGQEAFELAVESIQKNWSIKKLYRQDYYSDIEVELYLAFAQHSSAFGELTRTIGVGNIKAIVPPHLNTFTLPGTAYGYAEIVEAYGRLNNYHHLGGQALFFRDEVQGYYVAGVDNKGFFEIFSLPLTEAKNDLENGIEEVDLLIKYPAIAFLEGRYKNQKRPLISVIKGDRPNQLFRSLQDFIPIDLPPETLGEYAGRYSYTSYNKTLIFKISIEGGKMYSGVEGRGVRNMTFPTEVDKLSNIGPTRDPFIKGNVLKIISFQRDENNRITGILIDPDGFEAKRLDE